jgi:selenocysteine lyase/cysteine desulfurase
MFERYSRQTTIPEIGIEGQKRLSNSCATIIGCGVPGTVRVSPGYFNTIEEIETTIQTVRKIANKGARY